jgi:hypothetical protein
MQPETSLRFRFGWRHADDCTLLATLKAEHFDE